MGNNYELPDSRADWTPAEDALASARRDYQTQAANLKSHARFVAINLERVQCDCDKIADGQYPVLFDMGTSSREVVARLSRLSVTHDYIEILEGICQETEPKHEEGDHELSLDARQLLGRIGSAAGSASTNVEGYQGYAIELIRAGLSVPVNVRLSHGGRKLLE